SDVCSSDLLDGHTPQQVRIDPMAVGRFAQVGLGRNRFQSHQPQQAAYALLVHPVALFKSQEITHPQYAMEAMLGELLIHQAHQFKVQGALPLGLVVIAAARQFERTASLHNAALLRGGNGESLAFHAHRAVFFSRSFSIFNRPISANSFSGSYPPGMVEDAVGVPSKTPAACSANCFFHWPIWAGATSKRMASSAIVWFSFTASRATCALNAGVNFLLLFRVILGQV